MKTIKIAVAIFVGGIACMTLVSIVSHYVTGGSDFFAKVKPAIENDPFIQSLLGRPINSVRENNGVQEVDREEDGTHNGICSVDVEGSKGKDSLKILWREIPNRGIGVTKIYRVAPFAQDRLLWSATVGK